jgi:hypothetical protein
MSLIETLVNKDLLSAGTIMRVNVPVTAAFGAQFYQPRDLILQQIVYKNNEPKLVITDREITMTVSLNTEILAIDGMSPSRYADTHDIKETGENKTKGKKRGRKTKIRDNT